MTVTKEDYTYPAKVHEELTRFQADFTRVTGRPFKYFLCPILLVDERVPLCMGHIINEACPGSFGGRVVQRQDVDGWYGSFAESDFTANAQFRAMSPADALRHPDLGKKLRPKFFVGGEEWPHYQDRGQGVPGHTRIALHIGQGEPLRWVVKKPPEEVDALRGSGFQLALGKDCRLAALVSLIKAAYLTMFKLLGYSYALDEHGRRIGHDMLGKFFREHGAKKAEELRGAARDFFRPHVSMMRTIERFEGAMPLGTIEDHRARLCVTPAGTIFAIIVCIRTDAYYYDVLMPYFEKSEGASAYDEFMRNASRSLRVHTCLADAANKGLIVSQEQREITWPKDDAEFTFE